MTHRYSDEQKIEMSQVFAQILHTALMQDASILISEMSVRLLRELHRLPWFTFSGTHNQVLRHLEESQVYGVYYFHPDNRPSLYLKEAYTEKFFLWTTQRRPPLLKFLAAYPKAEPRKPSEGKMCDDPIFGISDKTRKHRGQGITLR